MKFPVYNARFEITFTRNVDDDALFLTKNTKTTTTTQDTKEKPGKINILELKVLVSTITYDEITKFK